ncbi:pectate lyase [Truncatella angustata]|uniref:Pectate lyase n=1 Tax=Truncatella angustata TaxID=152316 RepID=A0A9P8RNR4_9PEZI|nr:pectate lyase [Truncatella angustata]KAH6647388.1 pectate lyase [Truncatella angustata]
MHKYTLIGLLPIVLGCSNPDTNACASYISGHVSVCSTYLNSVVTATTSLPTWASNCSNKPSAISKECSCYTTGGSGATTTASTTTTAATTIKTSTTTTAGSGSTPTGLTTKLPSSSGAVSTSVAITVSSSFDGGMKKYDRYPVVCDGQTETGEADAIFVLKDGATLSNVIIGAGQAEGVHCQGTCTINNVWWQDVCEDAITFKQSSGTSNINGGGAFAASDKIVQFNGFGTVSIKNFYAEDYGKLSRSCGNCDNNGGARHIVIDNVIAVDGGVLCGINGNYGDSCTISNSCQDDGKSCDNYEGNNDGDEPTKVSSGNDGTYCIVKSLSTNC